MPTMASTSKPQDSTVEENKENFSLPSEVTGEGFSTNISHSKTAFHARGSISILSTEALNRQKDDMQSILDIFQLDGELPDGLGGNEPDEGDEAQPANLEDRRQRTDLLRGIYPVLDGLWSTGSEYITGAAKQLADGSRDPRWRIPMGESGILTLFLAIAATEDVETSLMIQVLRLIGNSCADTDENREMVVSQGHISSIIALLKKTALLPFVIPVLFNICVDYEPAQEQASESYLTKALIELIPKPCFMESISLLGYVCKLIDLLAVQPHDIELAPENTPGALLHTALDPELNCDLNDFIALTSCAIAYLRHESFQQAAIRSLAVQDCYKVMVVSYTKFEDASAQLPSALSTTSPDQDDAKSLSIMRSHMNQVLSDISALPEFSAAFSILSPFSSNLQQCLSSPHIQLQVMACVMLGNMARSDSACEEFVHTCQIHQFLLAILTEANDSQILYAALGFLKNLAVPQHNKQTLGDSDLISILSRLWDMSTLPQIQYSSISLARQLLNNSFKNVSRICIHSSDDEDSPAYKRTRLSILIALFQKTDAEPIKMEIARLLAVICRVLTSPSQHIPNIEGRRKEFFDCHPDVRRPLGFMVSQKKWPIIHSEGWFVMALMARTSEGAIVVNDILLDTQVFQALVELLTKRYAVNDASMSPADPPVNGGKQLEGERVKASPASTKGAEMTHIDRENALVLVSEVLRNYGSEMDPVRQSLFRDLLKDGGVMHLSYQQVKQREAFYDGKATEPKTGLSMHNVQE